VKISFVKMLILSVAFSIGFTAFKAFNLIGNSKTEIVTQNIEPLYIQEPEIGKNQLIVIDNSASDESFPDNENADENNFDGWYSPDHRSPNMKEVIMIVLSKDCYNYDEPKSYGGVFTTLENYGDQGHFGSSNARIDGEKVNFRTEKIKGIEYRFEGTFFREKMPKEEGEKVLRGTLQKFVKGKKVAQISGDFGYSEPHCWH